ncbi:hypothetical protein GCM10029992_13960 [Glycomyces albus]
MENARKRWVVSLIVSSAAVVAALVWSAAPDTYPYGSGDTATVGVNRLIERGPAILMLLTAAVAGMVLAGIALRPGASEVRLRIVGLGAAAQTAFFAIVMADGSSMAALGYAVALAAPIGAAVAIVLVCRTWRPVGYVLAGLALALGIVGASTGILGEVTAAAVDYLGNFTSDPEGYYSRMAWGLAMAVAAASWAWTAAGSLFRGLPPWLSSQWGRFATVVAALCLVPYGLARLSWLTPWRLGDVPVDEPDTVILWNADPEPLGTSAVIQGALFAFACAVGVVLTLGLISRWGEVFPGWIPVVGGREVPVKLAVIPGLTVAVIVTLSSHWIIMGPMSSGGPGAAVVRALFLPFPIWGPALGIAVLAYWARRTGGRVSPPSGRGPAGIR